MRIYVASSWRNQLQPAVVELLRVDGHEVYDFKNPPGNSGFGWEQLDCGDPDTWDAGAFVQALKRPRAVEGYLSDMQALRNCDACLLVLLCGRSAHLELGWAVGAGKTTAILLDAKPTPELMYKMVDLISKDLDHVRRFLRGERPE